jgi:hypothetical protein
LDTEIRTSSSLQARDRLCAGVQSAVSLLGSHGFNSFPQLGILKSLLFQFSYEGDVYQYANLMTT